MKRRTFFRSMAAGSLALPWLAPPAVLAGAKARKGTFALDHHHVQFHSPDLTEPLRVLLVADTHLFLDDVRGEPFRQYSGRMAKAYNHTKHFQTGAPTHPQEGFENALKVGRESQADLLALVGDIFSFPSEAAIEWVRDRLAAAGLPYLYVAGNHDWHYEGLPGSLDSLRSTWIQQRLLPLYQGRNPLMAAYDVGGIRFLTIDNSHYEILPAQLKFFRAQVRTGQPLVLFVHIPLYAPGRPLGFGCGHPDWCAQNDRNFELERRPRWPESGHTRVTLDFHREVFAAANLLGVFAGHTHRASVDLVNGTPQFVTDANATGAYLDLEFLPHRRARKLVGRRA